ncbi:CHAT domain-containing protein [Aerosakkonema funiforme]|uniref:CHAT domain-containing protein n=1 Tax=Aerosakkonema funiforme TaxID=1246630 RepID=UPI0035BB4984
MKIKYLAYLTLGILAFICAIWIEKSSASLLYYTDDRLQIEKRDLVISQVSRSQVTSEITTNRLEEQAQELYETGQFEQAIDLLQQLAANYASQSDELGQARVWRNLALVYRQTGDLSKANEAITNSFNRLQTQSNTVEKKRILAQAFEVKGLLQLSVGQPEEALDTWKQAAEIYKQVGDLTGITKSQINQAQALQRLGLYRQAIETLDQINANLKKQPDTPIKVKGMQSLGIALRVVGELDRSQKVLQESLAISQKLSDPELIASSLSGLGNTARLQKKSQPALDYYRNAVQTSSSPYLQTRVQVNMLSLLVEEKKWQDAIKLVPQIQSNLSRLPLSQIAINARINLANSLMKMGRKAEVYPLNKSEIAELLATAVQQAENLNDKRSLAYALGNLGRLYEHNKQLGSAKELTEKALLLAQGINASDIAYRWQWQEGRILKQQGNRVGAIAAYSEAVNTLQAIRSDLAAISSEAQFSFQESIEPVYRELVDLLLPPGEKVEESDLRKARDLIDSLQIAELDNFFKDACLKIHPVEIDKIDPKAAVLSTIILPDRLEVILALPGQTLRRYTATVSQEEIEATIKQARDALTVPRLQLSVKNFLEPSQKVYNWLLAPMEAELANSGIKTLVFVLDGVLRNIPMSALYDGKTYLIDRYSVAIAPSLKLVDSQPLAKGKLEVLTAGLSEARQGFSPLPGVNFELEKIANEVDTEKLLNQSFTTSNFKTKVKVSSFPIVHLATHGQFSSEANDTFILTWDDRINAKELDSLLRADTRVNNPIELLVLSACQTATGDKRAVLGLTGMAMRAGARSTVASLWSVNDDATALLMIKFYEELAVYQQKSGKDMTKASALRQAQQAILHKKNFSHPYYWAAFILVGNWL